MTMTLSDFKTGMNDKVAEMVVDIFLRESEILQMIPFDDSVSPNAAGGSTLTYAYMQKVLPSTAAFRALNAEYSGSEATMIKQTADLKIFGGKFSMDRVLKKAEGKYNNLAFQMEEKIKAAISLFHYTLINGDRTARSSEFDGLDKMLASTTTEFGTAAAIDISTIANLKTNADQMYEALQNLIKETNCDALFMNTSTISKIQTLARLLGYKTESEEAFGRKITSMDGIRLMDIGNHYTVSGSTATASAVVKAGITRTIGGASTTGLTDIYAVKFDINDGFHGATLTGDAVISQYLPDWTAPGAVKDGEVEMVAATVLKNTKHAGVLRNVKIA